MPQAFTRRTPPIPREGVYHYYWTFASRRQQVFQARLAGQPAPWTTDPILQAYKFCNVFRAADRVSQDLIRNVAYAPNAGTEADRAFQIIAYRTFSKPETWQGLHAELGDAPTLKHLASGAFGKALGKLKRQNGGLYTNAFILCANKAYGFPEKHLNHQALFQQMFLKDNLASKLAAAKSLQQVVQTLQSFPLMGPFMAYQTAIDLNYSTLLNFSENDYTQPGPGAVRGLKKVFATLGDYTPAETILWMVDNQQQEFERLGLPFTGLFGRPLHAIDCQGLFCETDKYCREAAPHLASNRSRIKTKFTPTPKPLPLFFPPKWGLELPTPKGSSRA